MRTLAILAALFWTLSGTGTAAQQTLAALGEPGLPSRVDRTVEITTSEHGFNVSSLSVRAGETVAFRVTNTGRELHEFMISTVAQYRAHMQKMADMMADGDDMEGLRAATLQHGAMMDDPNVIFVEPGATENLVWTFTTAGPLIFACNVRDGSDRTIRGDLTVLPR